MQFLHRFVAALLLVLYAPGSVLSALPLVWCEAADGHRAVEWCTGVTCDPFSNAFDRNENRADRAALGVAHDDDCTDWAIVAPVQSRPLYANQAPVAPPKLIPAKTFGEHVPLTFEPNRNSRPTYSCAPIPAVQLTHMRSVILLI